MTFNVSIFTTEYSITIELGSGSWSFDERKADYDKNRTSENCQATTDVVCTAPEVSDGHRAG